jgi:uroporphyrinogen-III synthase
MKFLIIRPEPGASASAARAKAAGFEPVILPFFKITPMPWKLPQSANYDALLLTSANAVRQAGPQLQALRHLPLHVVGDPTADAARAANLSVSSTGISGIDDAIKAALDAGHCRLLWLTGEDHKMPAMPKGTMLDIIICYASEPLPLPPDTKQRIEAADIVVLHSPRAARQFAQTADNMGLGRASITLAAFSTAIADAAGAGWQHIILADKPLDSALLSAVADFGRQQTMASWGEET